MCMLARRDQAPDLASCKLWMWFADLVIGAQHPDCRSALVAYTASSAKAINHFSTRAMPFAEH